jgi:hypothetical protein
MRNWIGRAASGLSLILPVFLGQWICATPAMAQWTLLPGSAPYTSIQSLIIAPTSPVTIYAANSGADGTPKGLVRSMDGGTSWALIGTGAFTISNGPLWLDPNAPNAIFAKSDTGIIRSLDRGQTWSALSLPQSTLSLNFNSSLGVYYAGGPDGIFLSLDHGTTWSLASSPSAIPNGITKIVFGPLATNGLIYAEGTGGISTSEDLGKSWHPVIGDNHTYTGVGLINGPYNLLGVTPKNIAYAVFSSYVCIRSNACNTTGTYAAVSHYDSGNQNAVFAFVGQKGNYSTFFPNIITASLTDPNKVYAVYGSFVFSADGGVSWTASNKGLQGNAITAIAPDSTQSGRVYLAQTGIGISVADITPPQITITKPATAIGDSISGKGIASINSNGSVDVVASASADLTYGAVSYIWSAACGGGIGNGSFSQTGASSVWVAPNNLTGNLQTCVLTVSVNGPIGGSASSTTQVAVRSGQKTLMIGAANGAKILWSLSGLSKISTLALNDPAQTPWIPIALSDTDSTGLSDLVWAYPDGNLIVWTMNGLSVTASGLVPYPGAGWRPVARGRFDGTSRNGLLFQNQGWLIAWNLNGATKTGGFVVGQLAPGWQVKFIADFDGDGRDDILAANDATGEAKIFYSAGNDVKSVDNLTAGPGWTLSAIGSFDGTGKLSVLWRNTNGMSIIWFWPDRGGVVIQQAGSQGMPIPMRADFDGDGVDDILWQYSDGSRQIMLMSGTSSPKASAVVLPPGNSFSAALLTDLTGDGRSDILWRAPTGMTIAWSMDGLSQTGGALLADYGNAYMPVATTNLITWPFNN